MKKLKSPILVPVIPLLMIMVFLHLLHAVQMPSA